jgi:hypothetical protein
MSRSFLNSGTLIVIIFRGQVKALTIKNLKMARSAFKFLSGDIEKVLCMLSLEEKSYKTPAN